MEKEIVEKIDLLKAAMKRIDDNAQAERRGINQTEANLKKEMADEIDRLMRQPGKRETLQNFSYDNRGMVSRMCAGDGYELRSPAQSKDWNSLFGSRGGYVWPDPKTSFFQALFSGRHHEALVTRSMSETVPSEGGFLVPSQTAAQIHAVALESEIILPNAFLQPMRSNELKIPAMAIGSHASSLMGGFTASFVAEKGTITEHSPTARSMTLNAKKLVGMLRFSSELAADIPGQESQIVNICGRGLAWYRDRFYIRGIGGGEPLGILNSPCLVVVPKESGQKKETITYENLIKMMSRLFAGSFANSMWIISQSCIPQLLSLSLAIGLGGSAIPVMSESNGVFKILTRPCRFTEKMNALGTSGDIMLCDLSQYVCAIRDEMKLDYSIHAHFETDELLARLITRFDGQSLWGEPLTLADGVTTVSPFVVLADRLV